MKTTYISIPHDLDISIFLQRVGSEEKEWLATVDIPLIETESLSADSSTWTCGLCGRENTKSDPTCGGCGAPPKHAKQRGMVRIESWLPDGGIFYSLRPGFTLYLSFIDCGRPDNFYEASIVYALRNCEPGPVQAINVATGCREEGQCAEPITCRCDIACDCVYVGAPWKEEEAT